MLKSLRGHEQRKSAVSMCERVCANGCMHTHSEHSIDNYCLIAALINIARRGIDIYLNLNLYKLCVFMRCDMVTLIHDQTHTRQTLSISKPHISINAVHSSSRTHFLFLSSTFFHHRSTVPDDPNDELTNFSAFIYYPFQRASHVRFKSLAYSDWSFNQIAYTATDSRKNNKRQRTVW